ncbi:MAG: pantoate--beta-alanine ligase [Calditrichaeota bacterium]|nr:MAG: pantoate--beta-alanine ligase [Calditrichota bacterium]
MKPEVISTPEAMRARSAAWRKNGERIGFVPTMGYLHEGHLSLIREARRHSTRCVVSIYVNPTQFAPGEDLDKYPRDFERDLQLCAEEGVQAVFFPDDTMMYPEGYQTYVYNASLSGLLCGQSRPTHFKGVTTIVAKLFNIVQPDVAVFGQKDAQQALIIRNMVRDLHFPIEIIVAPIVRESDGLAMSSRNRYLTAEQRRQALALYQSIRQTETEWQNGRRDIAGLTRNIRTHIEAHPACRVDYIAFVDARTLQPATESSREILLALAVYVGSTRLIDNTLLTR